jgi:poly-gamma-glutamate synthesis protein (capsule biosynthesis protein)
MSPDPITLFLCGDVMTGRGIDQVLPHPGDPRICEPFMPSAAGYVELAERANGPIPKPVDFAYVWGDALAALERAAPDARIVNLETSVTRRGECDPAKGISYRMNPDNVACLTAAKLDCCTLANNHVLDWGQAGLLETLDALDGAGLRRAGAGRDLAEAAAPAATERRPGVALLDNLSAATVRDIAARVRAARRPGDVVVASVHWGGNWGYRIPRAQRDFARGLIDEAGVDIVHGHSSHHPKGIEVYRERPILYGCGDFLDDYEGIGGYEEFRDDLALMYLPVFAPSTGRLEGLRMIPFQIRNFRLNRASDADARWLRDVLSREGAGLGTAVDLAEDGALVLRWR